DRATITLLTNALDAGLSRKLIEDADLGSAKLSHGFIATNLVLRRRTNLRAFLKKLFLVFAERLVDTIQTRWSVAPAPLLSDGTALDNVYVSLKLSRDSGNIGDTLSLKEPTIDADLIGFVRSNPHV